MFDNLSRKFSLTFNKITGRTKLTEGMLDDALSEIKVALLEADVSLSVTKKIISDIKEKAIGEKIIDKTTPSETITKIVYDELVNILGNTEASIPKTIMMVGLQGTGKTTTAAKLGLYYKNSGKNVLLASTDIYRPAAREQLDILAKQIGVNSLSIIENESVDEIIKRIKQFSYSNPESMIIIDTAGRLQIDDAMMTEAAKIKSNLNPDEVLLVSDAMQGQNAINVAREFNERVGITGLVMTRADGDARGGNVISMLTETGAPVRWIGVGEKVGDLEKFYPDRIAGRILGMGDVVSLAEKAQEVVSEKEAEDVMKKMFSGDFDLNTMMWQIEKMKKMGPIGGLLKLIPGMGGMMNQIKDKINDKDIDKQLAILRSMTDYERKNPDIIFQSRKVRIANGSGTTVKDIENLIKRFSATKSQMKLMGGHFPFGSNS